MSKHDSNLSASGQSTAISRGCNLTALAHRYLQCLSEQTLPFQSSPKVCRHYEVITIVKTTQVCIHILKRGAIGVIFPLNTLQLFYWGKSPLITLAHWHHAANAYRQYFTATFFRVLWGANFTITKEGISVCALEK